MGPKLFQDRSSTSMLCKYGELAVHVQGCIKEHTSLRLCPEVLKAHGQWYLCIRLDCIAGHSAVYRDLA